MKRAKVSELKARLSSYLAEVRRGESIIVCDRITPIARIVPFEQDTEDLVIQDSSHLASELKRVKSVRLRKRVDVLKLLREDRDQR